MGEAVKYPAPTPTLKEPKDQIEVRKAFSDLSRVLEKKIVGEKTGSDPDRGLFVEYTEGPNAQEIAEPGTIPIRDASGALNGTLAGMPKDPTGFIAPESVIVSYDSATGKITLMGTVSAYWRGDLIPSLAPGWISPALTSFYAAPAGTYFLYYDGAEFVWSSTPWTFDVLQIATATYTAGGAYLFASRECHGVMPFQVHEEFHRTVGTYRKSGGAVSAIVIGSTTASERRPAIAATVLADEDLETTNAALAAGAYMQASLTGAGAANAFTAAAADIVPLSAARPYFNEYTGGAWAQTLMSTGDYMSVWLVAIPTTSDTGAQAYRYIWIQGQTSGSLAAQQSLTPANLNLGALVSLAPEFVFTARFIIRYIAADWSIVQVDLIASGRYIQITAASFAASTVNTANEATDATCFPLFVPSATGQQEPKTNADYKFDAATGELGVNGLVIPADKRPITINANGLKDPYTKRRSSTEALSVLYGEIKATKAVNGIYAASGTINISGIGVAVLSHIEVQDAAVILFYGVIGSSSASSTTITAATATVYLGSICIP